MRDYGVFPATLSLSFIQSDDLDATARLGGSSLSSAGTRLPLCIGASLSRLLIISIRGLLTLTSLFLFFLLVLGRGLDNAQL